MNWTRWALLVCGAVAGGCSCAESQLVEASSLVRAPAAVQLGHGWVGYEREVTFDVANEGRAPAVVELQAGSNSLRVETTRVRLAGGAKSSVVLYWKPDAEGAFSADIRLQFPGGDVLTQVEGHARLPPSCASDEPCRVSGFDPDAGTCREEYALDGSACDAGGCVEEGQCLAGACYGKARVCDDGNACTIDACQPHKGCIQVPVECDGDGPCSVGSCDPAVGCRFEPAPASTLCFGPCGIGSCDEGKCSARDGGEVRPYMSIDWSPGAIAQPVANGETLCWIDFAGEYAIRCMDLNSSEIWDIAVYADFYIAKSHLLFAREDRLLLRAERELVAFEPASGTVAWRQDLASSVQPARVGHFGYLVRVGPRTVADAQPIYSDGDITYRIRSFDIDDGSEAGSISVDLSSETSTSRPLASRDGAILLGPSREAAHPAETVRVERSGEKRWRRRGSAPVAMTDDLLLLQDGARLDLETGDLSNRPPAAGDERVFLPVIGHGLMFSASRDEVYAYRLSDSSPAWRIAPGDRSVRGALTASGILFSLGKSAWTWNQLDEAPRLVEKSAAGETVRSCFVAPPWDFVDWPLVFEDRLVLTGSEWVLVDGRRHYTRSALLLFWLPGLEEAPPGLWSNEDGGNDGDRWVR